MYSVPILLLIHDATTQWAGDIVHLALWNVVQAHLQPRSMVTPSATLLDKAKKPWPPPRIPKGQSLAARVLTIEETSFAP